MKKQILDIPEEATTGSSLFRVSNKFAWEVLLWADRESHVYDLISDAELFGDFPPATITPPKKIVIDEIKVLFNLVSSEDAPLRRFEKCPTIGELQDALLLVAADTEQYSLNCKSIPVDVIPTRELLFYWDAESGSLKNGSQQLKAWKREILDTRAEQWEYHREQEYVEAQLEAIEEEKQEMLEAQNEEREKEREIYNEIMEEQESPPPKTIGFKSTRPSE